MRILSGATVTVRRLLDVVLLGLILLVVVGVVLAKVVPVTGRETIIVGGKSMEPALTMGSAIIVAPVPSSQLRVGDVITLRAGDDHARFTHRIIEIVDRPDGRYVQTKGDANARPDPTLVHESAIEGRVQAAIPMAGYLIALLSIPTGVLFVIGIAATLLAAVWLLESLELDQVDRSRVAATTTGRLPDAGEPLAARSVAGRSLATDSGFGTVRLSVADQIALSRSTRARRDRWQADQDASRRPTSRGKDSRQDSRGDDREAE
jgi:signal peptidase